MKSDSIPTDKGRSILMRIFQTNSFVFIFFFIVLAVILTHVVPAGAYEYVSMRLARMLSLQIPSTMLNQRRSALYPCFP